MPSIIITGVNKISSQEYSVVFTSDFTINNLSFLYSIDEVTWSQAQTISSVQSPIIVNIPDVTNFRIKLTSYIQTKTFSNKFSNVFGSN